MRFITGAVIAAAAATLTACGSTGDGHDTASNASRQHSTATSAGKGGEKTGHGDTGAPVAGALPAWSNKSPEGGDPAEAPPKYHVIKEFSGDNAGKPITSGTTYRLQPAGTGMLYRFACNDRRMDTGRYFSSTAGTVKGDWQPDSYVTAAAHNERSGAYYFDWAWLASGIASQPRAFIAFYGDCKWEARIINVTM